MSKITLAPDVSGTGTFTIAAPDSSTDRTLTLPDNSGTLLSNASTAGFPAGSVLQVVNGAMSGSTTTTSTSYVDATGASATITPSSASSKILVLIDGQYATYSVAIEGRGNFRVLRGGTTLRDGLSFGWYFSPDITSDGNTYGSIAYNELDSPSSTSPITYKVQFQMIGGANQVLLTKVSVTLMEIAA